MRNYLLNGHTEIFGAEIGTLIYGAGKGIIRSFQDFDLCEEPYMNIRRIQFIISGIWIMRVSVYTKIWQKNFAADGKSFLLCRHIRLCLEK